STSRWCLEPFLALSTGLGPVSEPPFSLARGSSPQQHATTQSRPPLASAKAAPRAACPTRRTAAIRPGDASREPRSRSRAGADEAPGRKMCPADPVLQHEKGALHPQPIVETLATGIPEPPLPPRQQRLEQLPE